MINTLGFYSEEEWKTSLVKMPDTAFSNIMRNYLGPIETPFNKHNLIERLATFLKREEVHQVLLDLLDEEDARLLTLVPLLGTWNRLREFMKGDYSPVALEATVKNLEERLWIYRMVEADRITLAWNPLLRDLLESRVYSLSNFISKKNVDPEQQSKASWFSWSTLYGFLSYLYRKPAILRSDGQVKKRVSDELSLLFPGILKPLVIQPNPKADASNPIHRLSFLLDVLQESGLCHSGNQEMTPRNNRIRSLEDNDLLYLMLSRSEIPISRRSKAAACAQALLDQMPEDEAFSIGSMKKLLFIYSGEEEIKPYFSEILRSLIFCNYLIHVEDKHYRKNIPSLQEREGAACLIQPPHEVLLKPSIGPKYLVPLSQLLEIRQQETLSRYEITREGFFLSRNNGETLQSITELLESLTEVPLSSNLQFTLCDWEEQFSSARLHRGTLLELDERHSRLVEQTDVLRPWLIIQPCPGFFLLDSDRENEWEKALCAIGIDHFHRPVRIENKRDPLRKAYDSFDPPILPPGIKHFSDEEGIRTGTQKKWLKQIESSKREEDREDMEERIQRKVILCNEQLDYPIENRGKIEAGGLDYRGKIHLIEDALADRSQIEITINKEGAEDILRIFPDTLLKNGNDSVLSGYLTSGRRFIKIRISRVLSVRKLRGSLIP